VQVEFYSDSNVNQCLYDLLCVVLRLTGKGFTHVLEEVGEYIQHLQVDGFSLIVQFGEL
jgi:hypothetical protein